MHRKFRRDKKYEVFVVFGEAENVEFVIMSLTSSSDPLMLRIRLALKADGVSSASVAPCDFLHVLSYC